MMHLALLQNATPLLLPPLPHAVRTFQRGKSLGCIGAGDGCRRKHSSLTEAAATQRTH